jgi:hypothetical protein
VEINLVQEQLLIGGAAFTHPISDGRAFCGEPIKAGRPTGFRNFYDAALACDTRRFNNDWYRQRGRLPSARLRSQIAHEGKIPMSALCPSIFCPKKMRLTFKKQRLTQSMITSSLLDKKGVGVSGRK